MSPLFSRGEVVIFFSNCQGTVNSPAPGSTQKITSVEDALVFGAVVGIGHLVATMVTVAINPNFPRPLAYAALNAPYFLLMQLDHLLGIGGVQALRGFEGGATTPAPRSPLASSSNSLRPRRPMKSAATWRSASRSSAAASSLDELDRHDVFGERLPGNGIERFVDSPAKPVIINFS
jgi:hypothetical protein